MRNKLRRETRRAWVGFLFTVPWVLGLIWFFLLPLVQSFIYSITSIDYSEEITYVYEGFGQYVHFFTEDSSFIRTLSGTIGTMLLNVVMVMFFSLFMANVLMQEFRGRNVARAIFFLPVIVCSGMVIAIIKGDVYSADMQNAAQSSQLQITVLRNILLSVNLSNNVINTLTNMLNSLFEISWKCGLQILIFMSGLRSISPSIKEAASIEGATAWEYFWKISVPMISPVIQLNLIYSIIDSFTDYSNPIIKRIFSLSNDLNLSGSTALAWIYFGIVFVIIGIIFAFTRKKVFYYVD